VKRAHSQRASREAGPRADGVVQVFEGSGPTIAGGERSEPPLQSAGREPGEVKPLAKITIVAESASASAEAPASAEAR